MTREERQRKKQIQGFIKDLPYYKVSFQKRVSKAWKGFQRREEKLRKLLDNNADGKKVRRQLSKLMSGDMSKILLGIGFEAGYQNKKHDFVFSPEGEQYQVFPLVNFKKQTPKEVQENWEIRIGRQPTKDFVMVIAEQELEASKIMVWAEANEEGTGVSLTFYSELFQGKLARYEDDYIDMMDILLDQVIGEINNMQYVDNFELVEKPLEANGFLMTELLAYIEENFAKEKSNDAEELCSTFCAYSRDPEESPDELRADVFTGTSSNMWLIEEFYSKNNDITEYYHKIGAVPCSITFPLYVFNELEHAAEKIFEFEDKIERAILEKAGEHAVTFIGDACGNYLGYLDLIAWDIEAVIEAADAFFQECDMVPFAELHSFHSNVDGIILKEEE